MKNNFFLLPHQLLRNGWLLACLFSAISLSAQIKPMVTKPAVRAVIIGISDYRQEQITDLRFADVDARAFANYLMSVAGGALPASNIQLLTNEKATHAQIASALTWLMEESKNGDQAIIYFSGHGDMETLTGMSFLLAYDASAAAYSGGGSFPVVFLQSIITRLSTQKQVQVLLITDACRAGKLAGNEIGGAQATAKILSDQFSNEIKILSCQPNEFSLEGTEWGGGRGVFSYYLLRGLMGMADKNNDQSVNLMEVGRYLEDQVPPATAPHSQIPMIVGNKGAALAAVDVATREQLNQSTAQNTSLSVLASKGVTVSEIQMEDTTAARLLRLFEQAMASGHLLEPAAGSAYELYLALSERASMQPHAGLLRRNLAAALQDESQIAINDYLSADPRELQRRWSFDSRYNKFPAYLEKAAELLGSEHFMYHSLLSRAHYFKGLNLRLEAEKNQDRALFSEATLEQKKAIELDANAVFAYNEIGHILLSMQNASTSIPYLEKALKLSPTWVLPWSNLCFSYIELRNWTEAEACGLKALQFDSTFIMANYNLGLAYQQMEKQALAAHYFRKTLQYDSTYNKAWFNLGLAEFYLGAYEKAEKTFQTYRYRMPNDPDGYQSLGEINLKLGNKVKAEKWYLKAIAVDPKYAGAYFSLGELAAARAEWAKAAKQFETYHQLEPEDTNGLLQLAIAYAGERNSAKTIRYLQSAFSKGFKDREKVLQHPNFSWLKEDAAFKALMGDK
jgi:tetratricopeptide (TPR) repeat protein